MYYGDVYGENSVRFRRVDPTEFTIVPSMQAQGVDVSLRYSRTPGFTMQGNDFPRLGASSKQKSRKIDKETNSTLPSEKPAKKKEDKRVSSVFFPDIFYNNCHFIITCCYVGSLC